MSGFSSTARAGVEKIKNAQARETRAAKNQNRGDGPGTLARGLLADGVVVRGLIRVMVAYVRSAGRSLGGLFTLLLKHLLYQREEDKEH